MSNEEENDRDKYTETIDAILSILGIDVDDLEEWQWRDIETELVKREPFFS